MKADLYVSNFLFEGFPGSVIEAMALNKPLLLSDIEEHREVATGEYNAIFFPPKDVNALVKGIEEYIDNPDMVSKYGDNSYGLFHEKFTEKAMIQGMVNLYRKVLN